MPLFTHCHPPYANTLSDSTSSTYSSSSLSPSLLVVLVVEQTAVQRRNHHLIHLVLEDEVNQVWNGQICFSPFSLKLTLHLHRIVVRCIQVNQSVGFHQCLPVTFPANLHVVHGIFHSAVHAEHVGIIRRRYEIHIHVFCNETDVKVQKRVVFYIGNTYGQPAFRRTIRYRTSDHRLDQNLVYSLLLRNTITDWLERELLVLEADCDGVVDADSCVSTVYYSQLAYTVSGLFIPMSKSRN